MSGSSTHDFQACLPDILIGSITKVQKSGLYQCEWYQCVCVTHVLLIGISSVLKVTYSTLHELFHTCCVFKICILGSLLSLTACICLLVKIFQRENQSLFLMLCTTFRIIFGQMYNLCSHIRGVYKPCKPF